MKKFDPRTQVRNPVMFVVWLGALVTAALTIEPDLFGPSGATATYNAVVTVILVVTVWFANLAEALAEGRGKAKAAFLRRTKIELRLQADRKALEEAQPELAGKPLPADMLTSSASGLDPDITPDNAALQAVRVARSRGVAVADVLAVVERHVTGRDLWLFGEPRVSVLALNLALQNAFPTP
ncbi:MAG: potassium-transporting ATPase subunit C [Xanthobacteraceae bacterium]